MEYKKVLDFWFDELKQEDWFTKSDELDETIRERFLETHTAVTKNETAEWRVEAKGALAEIIVLDQFSRNMFRDTPEAFASDSQALTLVQRALELEQEKGMGEFERYFLYMPYMHSESKKIHETALELFTELGNGTALKYEKKHKEIIDRFGRYPHRNEILGRESTDEEKEFLKQEGSSF